MVLKCSLLQAINQGVFEVPDKDLGHWGTSCYQYDSTRPEPPSTSERELRCLPAPRNWLLAVATALLRAAGIQARTSSSYCRLSRSAQVRGSCGRTPAAVQVLSEGELGHARWRISSRPKTCPGDSASNINRSITLGSTVSISRPLWSWLSEDSTSNSPIRREFRACMVPIFTQAPAATPVDRRLNSCLTNVSTPATTWPDHDKIASITEPFLAGWRGLGRDSCLKTRA